MTLRCSFAQVVDPTHTDTHVSYPFFGLLAEFVEEEWTVLYYMEKRLCVVPLWEVAVGLTAVEFHSRSEYYFTYR